MLSAVVAHSEETDAAGVAEELLNQCQEKLGKTVPRAGLLFAAIDFDHQLLLDAINGRYPGLELIGCTTDGEISSELGFREDSATLILFASDKVDITAGAGRGLSADVVGACRSAVQEALGKTERRPRLCLSAPEGLTAEGQSLTATLQRELGNDVPLFGALAGDQLRLESTRQFLGAEVMQDAIPVLLFSGDFEFSYGVATGWNRVGEPGQVTRASGAVVHEINGSPAIEFYRKYLGARSKPTVELPLAILNGSNEVEYLRTSWGQVDEATGAVTFLGAVPADARISLTVADRDSILHGCSQSLAIAKANLLAGAEPAAALIFSCTARKLILGTRTEEELKLLRDVLGDSVPVCGFYGYGEICPEVGRGAVAKYHNESFVTLILAD
jgi:hypothetical protein